MSNENRRVFPRANYPCQITVWLKNSDSKVILANTSNVAAGGVGVYLNESLTEKAPVSLQIDFQEPNGILRCDGIVVRSTRSDDRFFSIGIKFEHLTASQILYLKHKVDELIARENIGNQ